MAAARAEGALALDGLRSQLGAAHAASLRVAEEQQTESHGMERHRMQVCLCSISVPACRHRQLHQVPRASYRQPPATSQLRTYSVSGLCL